MLTVLGLAMTVFPFLPASNLFFPVGFVVAERVLYLPSMGFCLLIALGWDKLRQKSQKVAIIAKVCLLFFYCLLATKTVLRNSEWKDELSIFSSGLKITQNNAKLLNNVGHALGNASKRPKAQVV